MKKFLVTLAVTISVCAQAALAGEVRSNSQFDPTPVNAPVNARIKAAFDKQFAGASYIKWEKVRNNVLYQASFTFQGERFNVFYDNEGRLVASSRFIKAESLPLLVQQAIGRSYSSYTLLQVIELTQNEETSYLLTFVDDRVQLEVQAYSNGATYHLKKEKKNFSSKL
jgi:Protein of unknown function (DUF2874).